MSCRSRRGGRFDFGRREGPLPVQLSLEHRCLGLVRVRSPARLFHPLRGLWALPLRGVRDPLRHLSTLMTVNAALAASQEAEGGRSS